MDMLGHDDPGPQVKAMRLSSVFQGVDKPLTALILRQERQSAVAREFQKMGLAIIVMLHFLTWRQVRLVRHRNTPLLKSGEPLAMPETVD